MPPKPPLAPALTDAAPVSWRFAEAPAGAVVAPVKGYSPPAGVVTAAVAPTVAVVVLATGAAPLALEVEAATGGVDRD